jgi:mRNA interferase YafQ
VKEIVQTKKFKRDLSKIAYSGRYNQKDLLEIINRLANDVALELKHKDHLLIGEWQPCRECHIKPDWLLIYKLEHDKLILVRTGTHSELFG